MSVASSTTKVASKAAVAAGVAGAAALAGITYAVFEAVQEESTNTEEMAAAPSEEEENQEVNTEQLAAEFAQNLTAGEETGAAEVLAQLLTIDVENDESGMHVVNQFVTDNLNAGSFGATVSESEPVISVEAVTGAMGLSDQLLDDVETLFGIDQGTDVAVNASYDELGPYYKVLDIVELAQSEHVDAGFVEGNLEFSVSQNYLVDVAEDKTGFAEAVLRDQVEEAFGTQAYYTMAELATGISNLNDMQRFALGL